MSQACCCFCSIRDVMPRKHNNTICRKGRLATRLWAKTAGKKVKRSDDETSESLVLINCNNIVRRGTNQTAGVFRLQVRNLLHFCWVPFKTATLLRGLLKQQSTHFIRASNMPGSFSKLQSIRVQTLLLVILLPGFCVVLRLLALLTCGEKVKLLTTLNIWPSTITYIHKTQRIKQQLPPHALSHRKTVMAHLDNSAIKSSRHKCHTGCSAESCR